MLALAAGKAMDGLVNQDPAVDGAAADTILFGELPVRVAFDQMLLNRLFLYVHKLTLCVNLCQDKTN